jgi:prepilin-type N-terminal cleavage/methylation domain-containing protein
MVEKKRSGFTIVELLIVIVVIAILAALTFVAFNGLQNRARVAQVSSGLTQAQKKN